MRSMKAIVYDKYGPPNVLHLEEVPKPTPKDDEVLIEVHATTVTSGDARMRALNLPSGFGTLGRLAIGITGPRQKVLGIELAGVISAVGSKVKRWQVGNEVFAMSGMRMGCYAEFVALKETAAIATKPKSISFEEAAGLCFGGTTALDFFRRGKLAKGETLLVNGASGAVGVAAVQLAKLQGAHVTAVCSAGNAALIRSLGADEVIDYTKEDFTQNGKTYDVIMDNVGTAPFSRSKGSLKTNGRLLAVLAGLSDILGSLWVNMTSSKKVIAGPASEQAADVQQLAELVEQGKYKPVLDRTFPMEQIADAHAYVDSGRKKGHVAIKVRN